MEKIFLPFLQTCTCNLCSAFYKSLNVINYCSRRKILVSDMEGEESTSSQQDEEGAGDDQFWSQVMDECQANYPNRLPTSKSLLVVGDNDANKTQLVAKLKGIGEQKLRRGNGLEYHFLTVRDEYCEHQTKLDIWVLDEDPSVKRLLKYVINPETFSDTTVLLVATMTKPWDMLTSIKRWIEVLEGHIRASNIPTEELQARKAHILKRYQDYVEPTESIYGNIEEHISTAQIQNNIGLEIIVAITQTEYMTTLQTDFGFIDEHFDFIQFSLRKFCLTYGASLLYLSVKEDRNCDILHKYILHKIYSLPFRIPAMFLEKDSIFVPAGWDSQNKIQVLAESLATIVSSTPYEEVILQPGRLSDNSRLDTEVEAKNDQDFLAYIQGLLLRQPPESSIADAASRDISISGSVSPRNPPRRINRSPQKKQLESKLNNGHEDTVLQSFFKSLLKRQTSAPGERSVAGRGYIPDSDMGGAILENASGISSGSPPKSISRENQGNMSSGCPQEGIASTANPQVNNSSGSPVGSRKPMDSRKSLSTESELWTMEDYHARIQRALGNSALQTDVPDHFTNFLKAYKTQAGCDLADGSNPLPEESDETDVRQLPEYFMSSQSSGYCPQNCCENAAAATNGRHHDFDDEPIDRVRSKYNPPLRLLLQNSTTGKTPVASSQKPFSVMPEILKDAPAHKIAGNLPDASTHKVTGNLPDVSTHKVTGNSIDASTHDVAGTSNDVSTHSIPEILRDASTHNQQAQCTASNEANSSATSKVPPDLILSASDPKVAHASGDH